jgi:hypothetical protein
MDGTFKATERARAGAAGALLIRKPRSVQLLLVFQDKFGMLRVELDAVVIADAW